MIETSAFEMSGLYPKARMGGDSAVRARLAGLEERVGRLAARAAVNRQLTLVSASTCLPGHFELRDLLPLTLGATTWASFASDESTVMAIGEVAVFGGDDDLSTVGHRWELLTQRMVRDQLTESTAGPLIVFGGGSSSDIDQASPWSPFGCSRAVVPRIAIRRCDGQWVATASSVVNAPPPVNSTETPTVSTGSAGKRSLVSEMEFVAAVQQALARIRRGEVEKVVLTRSVHIDEAGIDPHRMLAHLDYDYPTTCRFAFARGATTFIGATPELLCAVRGNRLRTMALAGSVPPGHDPQAALDDPKLQREHAFVTSHIKNILEPKSTSVTLHSRPELIRLRNIRHMRTAIEAELHEGGSVLAAVQWLHPTPAVGGYPLAAARSMIAELDRTDRGWYTGPIGWTDTAGGGACWVALRCALLTDDGVELFAGAGIVHGSDPLGELAETNWKLMAMRSALPNHHETHSPIAMSKPEVDMTTGISTLTEST
jgi:isochorismate synthase